MKLNVKNIFKTKKVEEKNSKNDVDLIVKMLDNNQKLIEEMKKVQSGK